MKPLFAALMLAWCVTVSAQSVYTNITLCACGTVAEGDFTNLVFQVPANTTAEILGTYGENSTTVFYLVRPDMPSDSFQNQGPLPNHSSRPPGRAIVLGPVTVKIPFPLYGTNATCFNALVKFDAVNTTPGNIAAAQMPGTTRAVELQSSTNLTEWQAVAAVTNSTDESYKFYRVQIR
jgi:hypothetical protein